MSKGRTQENANRIIIRGNHDVTVNSSAHHPARIHPDLGRDYNNRGIVSKTLYQEAKKVICISIEPDVTGSGSVISTDALIAATCASAAGGI